VRENECVICGYTRGERDYFGALILGVYENNKLVWAGNVGTGFDQKLMKDIYERLQPLKTERPPFAERPQVPKDAVWVRPELVCTVKYIEWTRDGRLRAPVFAGLRPDVEPTEAVRELPSEPAAPATLLLPGTEVQVILSLDGQQIKFTNLNKVFYPKEGYTKRDI